MSINPLKNRHNEAPMPTTPDEWAARGNAYLRGEIAGTDGRFIPRRRSDVHFIVRDGRCVIEWKSDRIGQS